jgi:hypothetical protein
MFPRECPYPHGSGKVVPQTPDEWMQETGQKDSRASEEEMKEHIDSDTCGPDEPVGEEARKHHHFAENELPWDDSEELLRPAGSPQVKKAPTLGLGRCVAFLAFSSAISLLLLAAKQAVIGGGKGKSDLPFRHWHGECF